MSAALIVLNGVSSAGKTTLAKAIRAEARETFLLISMDDLIAMLPDGREGQACWFPVKHFERGGTSVPHIATGPNGEALLAAMRGFVAQCVGSGLSVVVDDVCEASAIADYRKRAAESTEALMVKVTAPLAVLERREAARGDRLGGLAREQAAYLHRDIRYDCEVDTNAADPMRCAQKVLSTLEAQRNKNRAPS